MADVPKLNLGYQSHPTHFRSGWGYALDALLPLHHDQGVLFDGYLEDSFLFAPSRRIPSTRPVPYVRPWIGFLHHPPYVPPWFGVRLSALDLLTLRNFRDSLGCCLGLFTLSRYLRDWYQDHLRVPVEAVLHPTEKPLLYFSMDAFLGNPRRCIVHVGSWLRKFHSFALLRTRSLRKVFLLPFPARPEGFSSWRRVLGSEARAILKVERQLGTLTASQPFELLHRLDDAAFDKLLSCNIVFLDLYDASANNTVVECIVRHTPILINKHPAAVEYLGAGYPLYFRTLREAEHLANDEDAIAAAHQYLVCRSGVLPISGAGFRSSVLASNIYRELPGSPITVCQERDQAPLVSSR
jgi:hypothetical protein